MSRDSFPSSYKRPLYRSRKGWVLGVCRGLADYTEIPVGWMRLLFIVVSVFAFPLPLIAYVIAAIFMKPAPSEPMRNDEDEAFYNTYRDSPSLAMSRLRRKFDQLDRRARRLEDVVTDRQYDWDERLRRGR